MYVVISRWDFDPANAERFESAGKKMRAIIGSWPEVESVQAVRIAPGSVMVSIGYKSEADYQRLVQSPDSPFEKAARENGIEDIGTWAWSERGEAVEA